ncbi:hypothetical protein LCGC14_2360520, partial [marine sediment metagenome]
VEHMVQVFREVRRVLRDDGTLWLNMGDCYAAQAGQRKTTDRAGAKQQTNTASTDTPSRDVPGLKPKDLVGQPWRVAFALQADSWYLRCDIIWAKPNPMPESCRDRPTKSHEYVFLLTKRPRYFFDQEAVREKAQYGRREWHGDVRGRVGLKAHQAQSTVGGPEDDPSADRNIRSVWTIATQAFPEAHFATFPEKLVTPSIKAGTSEKGCCPACGAPWVRVVEKTGGSIGKGWHDHEGDGSKGQRCELAEAKGSVARCKDEAGRKDSRHTTDWKPSCECRAPLRTACTVLDPFGGSGTTGVVAAKLGRKAILVELNPEYAEMARKRCNIDVQRGLFQP